MPSTKMALVALALAAAQLTAAGPIDYRSTNTDLAGEGEPCGAETKCETGLTCKQEHTQGEMSAQVMTCVNESKEDLPQKGKPCNKETGCAEDLECIEGTLENPNDKILTCQLSPVGEGEPCTQEQRCDDGLICGSEQSNEINLDVQTCQKPNKTKKSKTPKNDDKGSPTDETPGLWESCTKDSDCDGNLKCDVDNRPGMHTEDLKCQKKNPNEDDGKKGDGEPCSKDTDCEDEMTCEAGTPDTQNVAKIGTTVKQCTKKGLKAGSDCKVNTQCATGLQCLKSECDDGSDTATCLTCQLPTASTLPAKSDNKRGIQPDQDSSCTSSEDCASNQECRSVGMTKMLQCQDKEDDSDNGSDDGSNDGYDNTCSTNDDCKGRRNGKSICIGAIHIPLEGPVMGHCS